MDLANRKLIQSLDSSGHIRFPDHLSDQDIAVCVRALNQLVEMLARGVEVLKDDLYSGNDEKFFEHLNLYRTLLLDARAHKLVSECDHYIEYCGMYGMEKSTILFDKFSSNLLAFSIAIQVAKCNVADQKTNQLRSDQAKLHYQLAQLEKALTGCDQENAQKIIQHIQQLGVGDALQPVLSYVEEFQFDQAQHVLADLLEHRFNSAKRTGEDEERKRMILAVDDMPSNLTTLKGILGSKYRFVGVTSGAAALKFLESNSIPDAYILDIDMPEMNGFELLEQIRKKHRGAAIVFLTSNATAEYVIKAYEWGITDFLVKPCYEEAVLSKLNKIFGRP